MDFPPKRGQERGAHAHLRHDQGDHPCHQVPGHVFISAGGDVNVINHVGLSTMGVVTWCVVLLLLSPANIRWVDRCTERRVERSGRVS